MKALSSSSVHTPIYIQSPDGGWGWVVCLGSFGIHFILDGTIFCFGILYMDLILYFKGTSAQTACVGSILVGMHMMIGPLVSLLLTRFDHRTITMLGSLIASAAFIVSMWVEKIELLIFTYGFCGGIGFGMVFITANICLSLYFEKKRALATGLATSGAGVGTFVYPYLSEWLLSTYGWKGTVLILGGCVLNCLVCAAVFRPLSWSSRSDLSSLRTEYTNADADLNEDANSLIDENNKENENNLIDVEIKIVNLPLDSIKTKHTHSCQQLSASGWLTPNSLSLVDVNRHKISSLRDINMSTVDRGNYLPVDVGGGHRRRSVSHFNPLVKKDLYYSGSLTTLRRESIDRRHYSDAISEKVGNQELRFADNDSFVEEKTCCQESMLRHVFNFSLLKDKVFVLLLLAFSLATVQSISMMFLPNFAMSKGMSLTDGATLVSVIGITNTVGRILIGLITYYLQMPSIHSFTMSLFISGIVSFLYLVCQSFLALVACCAVYGLCLAVIVSLRTIVLADLLGIENLTQAFGVVALFQGIVFTINPPLAGMLFEKYNDYTILFAIVSACYICAGFFSLALSIYTCCMNRETMIPNKEDMNQEESDLRDKEPTSVIEIVENDKESKETTAFS